MATEASSAVVKRLRKKERKKANFLDRENIRLLEDVQENYGLLMQSLKTGSVVLKKREAWTRIDESVNESAREGGQCRPETLEGHATRPKAATRTGGGPPEPPGTIRGLYSHYPG